MMTSGNYAKNDCDSGDYDANDDDGDGVNDAANDDKDWEEDCYRDTNGNDDADDGGGWVDD